MTLSSFFSSPTLTLRGSGVSAEFSSVGQAHDAMAAGAVATVTGAFGFDPTGDAALIAPETFGPAAPLSVVTSGFGRAVSTITPADVHADRVRSALAAIGQGRVGKAVLARTLNLRFDDPIDPVALASRFVPGRDATTTTAFAVPLDAAGRRGHWLIGASPELLVRRSGRVVTCHPFAGTAPRGSDAASDRAAVESLRASDKDLREHAFVVDSLVNALRPLCTELDVPDGPQIQSTPAVWHLATPIRGVLADASITSLDLAALLSPTPAVCGTPTTAAAELIAEIEGPRDFYAGAVGWCDASGDGQWLVSIRCLELDAAHTGVTTWAGGGIVAGSDPDAEVAETEAKFRTVLSALGLSD
ncbi:isochorismate synthase [Gordonia malaquae]|uniref:isochorismate synthase n=1 Tax=Gordonia malaquae NBRC 108250 TaxID=1223542 RepID=M3VFY5_GORML|nr:isochorismate synthase [Gordonia malaquae]GAC80474.1 putative isochorismate synthase [Gordonia malaquae NBRC 108250]SEE15331.1 isochorismate synthase [Gordonia malaquae]